MDEHEESRVRASSLEPSAGKAAQAAMLLYVREAKFHGLLAFLVELPGFVRLHPLAMRLDQFFVLTSFYTAAAQRIGLTLLFLRAGT
jgi:hypothetical protein